MIGIYNIILYNMAFMCSACDNGAQFGLCIYFFMFKFTVIRSWPSGLCLRQQWRNFRLISISTSCIICCKMKNKKFEWNSHERKFNFCIPHSVNCCHWPCCSEFFFATFLATNFESQNWYFVAIFHTVSLFLYIPMYRCTRTLTE